MSRSAELPAPAKVNLVLRVLRERDDGYHEIETLFQAIDLTDEVRVELTGEGIDLEVRGTDVGPAEQNLAYRAAAALRDRLRLRRGLRISLIKRIPAGAGLGGGSSDAAAVLRCMGGLLGVEEEELEEVGAKLGSDVPFFLGSSPLAWGRGRGDVLEPRTPLPSTDLVLVSPPVHVSTAEAYRALDAARCRSVVPSEPSDPGASAGPMPLDSWQAIAQRAHNDFQGVTARKHPEVARTLRALKKAGAAVSLLSGSGSTCFGLFEGGDQADLAVERLQRDLGWPCRPARTLQEFPRLRQVAGGRG